MFKRNKRGRRLKRYRRSFYSGRDRAKQIGGLVLLAALVFGVGWLAGPHLIDLGTGLWYGVVNPKHDDDSSQAGGSGSTAAQPAGSQTAQSGADSQPQPTPTPDVTALPEDLQPTADILEGNWVTVSLSALGSPEAIQTAAESAAAGGAQYALVTLKDASGYIYYPSAVANASRSIAASTVDAAAVAAAFKAAGVTPVASLAAFRDPIASYTDRTMGIHYANSDYMWLDNAADAGGKPWLNPYSDLAVGFIGDLIAEVHGLGYDHVVLTRVQFPWQVSTKQDYGDTKGLDRAGALASAITAWGERFAGQVTLWYEYEYSECAAASQSLGALPAELGAANLLMRVEAGDEENPGPTAEQVDAAVQAAKAGGCTYVVVREGSAAGFR